MENRDKERPFILFVHHKACHRNWLPELKYLREYEDQTFEKPDNFWDTYEGRVAAQQQEMAIASNHDMDLAYDTKAYLPGDQTRLSGAYVNYVERLEPELKKQYWTFYDSLSCDFKRQNLQVLTIGIFSSVRVNTTIQSSTIRTVASQWSRAIAPT